MRVIVAGACVVLAGLALLLAMVVRVIEPSLLLSLLGYSALFAGMFLACRGRSDTRRGAAERQRRLPP